MITLKWTLDRKFGLYTPPGLKPKDVFIYRYQLNFKVVSNIGIVQNLKF